MLSNKILYSPYILYLANILHMLLAKLSPAPQSKLKIMPLELPDAMDFTLVLPVVLSIITVNAALFSTLK